MVRGRLFQMAGQAAVKDLSPIIFLPIRTVSRVLSDEDLVMGPCGGSDFRLMALLRYDGAHLLRHLKTSKHIL